MRTSSLSVIVVSALVLAGCRIEKPATVIPAAPSVDAFTVSAVVVAKGTDVTLSWKVSNASSIELREASTGALAVAADRFDGTQSVIIDGRSLFVLVARGAGGSDARAVSVDVTDPGATELNFQALPPNIPGGQDTTLVWTAPGAKMVTLAAGATMIPTAGQLGSGAVTVRPLQDTTYNLTADGVSKQVQVTVQPALLTLVATPTAVQPGDMISLHWTTAGADSVVVAGEGRGDLSTVTAQAMVQSGTFTETAPMLAPGSFLTYRVSAVKGTARLSKSVQVYVGSGLTIVSFNAPPVAAAGQPYTVRWQTLAAEVVELKVDGATVHQSANAQQAGQGQFTFTSPMRDFTVELVATDARSARKNQIAQVDSVGVPTTLTLTASTMSTPASSMVTLTWACPEARSIRIVDSTGVAVLSTTGQRAEGGMVTVYPSATTTYVATADNQLGSAPVSNMVTVTVTGQGLSVSQFPPRPLTGQLVNLSSTANALFVGFPHAQVLSSAQSDFLDISQTGTRVLETGGNVVTVTLPFSTLMWGTTQSGPLTISRAGWMAFAGPLVVNTSEVALPSTSTSAAPYLIAPYWDDLTLTANSAVFTKVVGDAPDQQLVVQWNHMQCGSTTNTDATFQARVHQNGTISFHYQTMMLNSSPSFTIGVQDGTRTLASRSTAVPTTNSALYFFSPVTAPELRVTRGSNWGGFVKVGNALTRVSSPSNAVSIPLDLCFTELMFRPDPSVSRGAWLEITNRTAGPLDLTGWNITSPTNMTSFAVTSTIPAGVSSVFGESTDPAQNDDAGVNVNWGGLRLERDAGQLSLGTADASITFTYTGPADAGVGGSVEIDPGPFVNTSGTVGITACASTRTYGSLMPQQRGSPGVQASCFGYRVSPIASQFVDISDAGTPLVNTLTSVDGVTVPITLAATAMDPAPTPFGVRQPIVSMSSDGWMMWGSTITTNFSNASSPTTLQMLAPFWDDLEVVNGMTRKGEMYWKRFVLNEDPVTTAPHWVFQWNHLSHYYSVGSKGADDLNFEVKLFDDGTIEYHYAAMNSGNSSNYGDGNSATVWLENLTTTLALFQSINQPLVRPNTAWRFTPSN